jgi:hypothetical protein
VTVVSEGATPQWYERPDARAALAARDVGAVYRLLQRQGVPQREIARRAGQSQSEVSEILRGRRVRDVLVLGFVNTNAGGGLVSDAGRLTAVLYE